MRSGQSWARGSLCRQSGVKAVGDLAKNQRRWGDENKNCGGIYSYKCCEIVFLFVFLCEALFVLCKNKQLRENILPFH